MRYPSLAWGIVGLCALLSGCALCAHPYDYTAPVISDVPGESTLGFCERAGSTLSGTGDVGVYEEGGADTGVYEGASNSMQGAATLSPASQPQAVGYTSRRVTTHVAR